MSSFGFASACLLAALSASGTASQEASHLDCSFELDGRGFESFFHDFDGDGRSELVTTLLAAKTGRREIQLRTLDKEGRYPAQAQKTVEVLPDVVAWAIADVRPDPGHELVFLTRTGAFSYSIAQDGYQGNIQRMLRADMLLDVPDPNSFPRWRYVVAAPDGDRILLPLHDGFSIWSPVDPFAQDESLPYVMDALISPTATDDREDGGRPNRKRDGSRSIRIGTSAIYNSPLLPEVPPDRGILLNVSVGYAAPALADVDGNGTRDMLFWENGELRSHLNLLTPDAGTASSAQTVPDYMRIDDDEVEVEATLIDVDADGDIDMVVRISEDGDGLSNSNVDLLILRNHGGRLLPAQPDQVMRFEAAELRFGVADVNNDGKPDLVIRKFEMPSMVEVATGLEFRSSRLVYFGAAKRPQGQTFERKPSVKEQRVFDAESLGQAIGRRQMSHDVSGDGFADEVEVTLNGEIEIRRLKRDSGFFSGVTWEIEANASRSFDVFGNIGDLTIADANGDGIADIISSSQESVAVLLSRRTKR